jgi:16S rRNA (guanine527-N7)-methyltransferase
LLPEAFRRETGVSRETLARLDAYLALLNNWQRRINLVGATSLADAWRRHMLDSAQLFPLVPSSCERLLDLGSGAGFPGLVLAIMGVPGVELVESDGRKCTFLAEAARITDASVTIHHTRIESLAKIQASLPAEMPSTRSADVITARACAPLPRLLGHLEGLLAAHTLCLFPKGARVDEELTQARKEWRMNVERLPSRSDPKGCILYVQRISRDPGR